MRLLPTLSKGSGYSELLCFKAIEEGIAPAAADPDNTPTVIIELRDFYPRSRSKEQYIEIVVIVDAEADTKESHCNNKDLGSGHQCKDKDTDTYAEG